MEKTRSWIFAGALALCIWGIAERGTAQPAARKQYVLVLKHGPKWVDGKPVAEQKLNGHGQYLQSQMEKGALQIAGPFLDDSGGLIIYNAESEAAARDIEMHDPGVMDQILAIESVRPFSISFDAATGLSPFKR